MTRRISLVGLIEQKWIEDGRPRLNWDDLLKRTMAADNELERKSYNPALRFREFRRDSNISKMRKYIRGFYRYGFYPRHAMESPKPKQGKAVAIHDRSACVEADHSAKRMGYQLHLNDEMVADVINQLRELYPAAQGFQLESEVWHRVLHRRSPYRVLILFGLSRRQSDGRLVDLCRQLFKLCRDLESFTGVWYSEVEKIRDILTPFGLANKRMQFIDSAVSIICENGNTVPSDRKLLMRISQVGEKTVECILAYGFGIPAMPVDYHVCWVIERIFKKGITSQDAAYVRRELKRIISNSSEWIDTHELLRLHAISICQKGHPKCELCPLTPCRSRDEVYQESEGISRARKEARRVIDTEWEPWRQLICEP